MNAFRVGDTVRITGSAHRGAVGTVIDRDEEGRGFLVRISEGAEDYFPADELELLEA